MRRAEKQQDVTDWVTVTFGSTQANNIAEQATRLLEEALETAQAAGVPVSMVTKLAQRVYDKEPGDLSLEIGQVGLCLLAVSAAAGVDADTLEDAEVAAVRTKPAHYYHTRYLKKIAEGVTIHG